MSSEELPLQAVLTEQEKQFIVYWEANRLKKKKVLRQLSVGLPLAAVIVVAIFINFFSGWYKKADMVRNQLEQRGQSSLILVLLIACIIIVVFITIFSVRHKWDRHEQYYRELLNRSEGV